MNESELKYLLQNVSRLTLVVEVTRVLLGGLGLFIAAVLLALTIDAILSLQTWGLIALDAGLAVLFTILAIYTCRIARRNLFHPQRAARLIEQQLGIRDNRLINAVDFALSPTAAASPELIRKSVDAAESFAAEHDSVQCTNFSRLRRPVSIAVGVAMFALASYFLVPQAFGMVIPRLLDPAGDHPPYTLLQFDVQVTPKTIYHGRGANISVTLSGPQIPHHADIVTVRQGSKHRTPMFREKETRFLFPIEHATSSCEFYVDTPLGRSRRFDLTVLQVPLFEKVGLVYQYPSYTAWSSHQQTLDNRGIQALKGTQVTLRIKSNLPLRNGLLELTPIESETKSPMISRHVPLVTDRRDVSLVSATFPMEYSGRFRLTLTATNGATSLDPLEGQITCIEDRPPQVAIMEPAPHLVVVENFKVPVLVQASDDIAVNRLRLFRSINGWGPTAVDLPLNSKRSTRVTSLTEFDLAALGARAGDVIQYFASVDDNCPPTGQSIDSDTYVIQVISEAEYLELARRDYQLDELEQELQKFRRQLDQLQADRNELLKPLEELQKKLEGDQSLSSEEQKQLQKLAKQVEDFQKQAEKVAKTLAERAAQPQLYDMEQPYQEMLQKLGQKLEQQAANAKQLAEKLAKNSQTASGTPQDQQQLQETLDKFQKENDPFDEPSREELRKSAEDLKLMQQADDLLANAEQLRSITLKQRDLADRLAQFRNQPRLTGDDQQRANRLAKEQELLQQELEEATQTLQKSAESARKDLPQMASDAQKLAQELSQMNVPGDQSQASRQARQGGGEQAHQASESAARKLESLMSKLCQCKGAGEEVASKMDGPLKLGAPGMQKSLSQLSQGRKMPGLPGNAESQGQAQTGQGIAGSRSKTVIMGPHQPSKGDSEAEQAALMKNGGRGRGLGFETDSQGQLSPESLLPAGRFHRATSGQNMRGVPVGYRDQAEAYFKRIAEGK